MPRMSQFESREEYNKWQRDYRDRNREKFREYNRIYNKEWRKENGYYNEYNSKKRYPERHLARKKLYYAVKIGKVIRGVCVVCGDTKVQAHHHNYSKPLDVIWLCTTHHNDMHRKFG